jgi:hypothetical protein
VKEEDKRLGSTRMSAITKGAERKSGVYEMDQSESNSSRSMKYFPTFHGLFIRQQEVVPTIPYLFDACSCNCNQVRRCATVSVKSMP